MIPRRGAIALVLTTVALILLLSFKTPAPPSVVGAVDTGQGGAGTGGTVIVVPTPTPTTGPGPGSGPVSTPTAAPGSSGGSIGAAAGQFTGAVVETPYGTVQVRITVSGGRIADITALQLPADRRRSTEISQYAGPILRSEAIAAQSATIDTVSGATYTSEGYEQSLQSAIDQAHG
jgi:uncharacterized protein with FMN-binding domain